jgi:hypothetical protein
MACLHNKKTKPECVEEWCNICVNWQDVRQLINFEHCEVCRLTHLFFKKNKNNYDKRVEIIIHHKMDEFTSGCDECEYREYCPSHGGYHYPSIHFIN